MADLFQIDLAQTGWRPAAVEELACELGRATEVDVRPADAEFVGLEADAAADAPREVLDSDEAVRGFCGVGAGDDADGEAAGIAKVIRAELPAKVIAKFRQPRKLSLLSNGRQLCKFSGQVGDSKIEVTLKVFSCGHFRIKEHPLGAPSSPRNSVAEGRWTEVEDALELEYLVRFTERQVRRRVSSPTGSDATGGPLIFDMVPPEVRSATLHCPEGKEGPLVGTLPTLLTAPAEVELHSQAGALSREAARRQEDDDDDEDCRQALGAQAFSQPMKLPSRPKPADDDWDSDEPTWPMYLGIFLFIVIFCVFGYLWYEERYYPETAKEYEEL